MERRRLAWSRANGDSIRRGAAWTPPIATQTGRWTGRESSRAEDRRSTFSRDPAVWMRHLTRALLVAAGLGPLATRGTAQGEPKADPVGRLIADLHAGNVEVRR